MKCYGLFHGGGSYSPWVCNRDIESFDSIQQAKYIFEARLNFDPHFPCVDEEQATMILFFDDPRTEGEPDDFIDTSLPDRLLETGPRGGILYQRC